MPKESSNSLHTLIHKLTPNEKSYFKKYAKIHSHGKQSKYMDLYELLCKQEVYDCEELRKKIRRRDFDVYIARAKNYLYGMVLQSMRQYHRGDGQLFDMLQDQHFLQSKGMYKEAKRVLTKLIKCAAGQEAYEILLLALQEKSRLIFSLEEKGLEEKIVEKNKMMRDALDKLNERQRYSLMQNELSLIHASPKGMEKDVIGKRLAKKIDLVKREIEADSFGGEYSRILAFSIASSYAKYQGDIQASLEYLKMMEAVWNENGELKASNMERYIKLQVSLVDTCILLGEFEEAYEYLQKIREFGKGAGGELFEFMYVRFDELLLYMNTDKWGEALALVEEVKHCFKQYSEQVPAGRLQAFMYNVVLAYWFNDKEKEANQWLNLLLNGKAEQRNDVKSISYVLEVVFLWETDVIMDVIDSKLLAIQRGDTKKHREARKTYAVFLAHFSKAVKAVDRKEMLGHLDAYMSYCKETYTSIGYGEILLLVWVVKMLNGITMKEAKIIADNLFK